MASSYEIGARRRVGGRRVRARVCRALQVSANGCCAWRDRLPSPRRVANSVLSERIRQVHAESHQTYGMPRVRAELIDQGLVVSRKRVAALMRQHGIRGISRRRGFTVTTRRDARQRPAPDLVFVPLNMALQQRKSNEVIHHSDQGSQYTSIAFGERCQKMGVRPSMGTAGDAYDNAMAERFFASLEGDLIDRKSWQTETEAPLALFTCIEGWYNPRRRHSALDYLSPANYESKNRIRSLSGKHGLPTVGDCLELIPMLTSH